MKFLKRRLKMIDEAVKMGLAREEAEVRQSGRSLGHALETIGHCLQNPEIPIRMRDHYIPTSGPDDDGVNTDRHMIGLVRELVRRLELEGFVFHQPTMEVAFSLKEEPEIQWTRSRR